MQTSLKPLEKPQRLWSLKQIFLASLLAGPIAGCYFMGKNFKKFGLPADAKKCYLAGILGTLLITTLLALIPERFTVGMGNAAVPPSVAGVILLYARMYQKHLIEEKISQEAKRFSYMWFFFMVCSLIVIQLAVFALYVLLTKVVF